MWLFLNNETTIFNDKLTLLHFAPERFFLDRFMKMTNLSYTPADINPSLPLIKKIDIIDIPMNDNHYDCVICCHVLEHVHDDQKAMREIYRVLKPGGWAILQVPIGRLKTFEDHAVQTPQDRQRVFGQHDHVRIYGLDYVTRLETAGFKVNVINYAKKVSDEKIRKYALSQKDIYLCSKERAS
ncbi:MAG: class I SAM-dependent methyltransferase [Patescibacteria group bacterium]